MPQVYTLSFALFCRWATPRAESWYGPVPVIHLRITARCHRLIRGERGSPFVWGQTLPAHPGHILGVPSRSRGWAAPASDTVTSNIVNNAVAVRRTIGLTHKSFWRAVVTKHVAQWKRISLHCVLSQANVHCSPRLRLICACIFPTGLAFNTELLRFFFKSHKASGFATKLEPKARGKETSSYGSILFYICANQKIESSRREKMMDGTLPARRKANY